MIQNILNTLEEKTIEYEGTSLVPLSLVKTELLKLEQNVQRLKEQLSRYQKLLYHNKSDLNEIVELVVDGVRYVVK